MFAFAIWDTRSQRLMLARDGALDLLLRVTWAEGRRRLRLRVEPPTELVARTDLVSGGPLVSGIDERE